MGAVSPIKVCRSMPLEVETFFIPFLCFLNLSKSHVGIFRLEFTHASHLKSETWEGGGENSTENSIENSTGTKYTCYIYSIVRIYGFSESDRGSVAHY